MAERTVTFDKQIKGDRFEIARISFDGVRQTGGFNRSVWISRPQYKVNGKVVSRAMFFALKDAAEAEF
jgi:hypothetical protein